MKKKKNTLIWEIRKKDLPPSYIIGTMHIKDSAAFTFKSLMYRQIENCEAFATEFNLEEANLNLSGNAMDLPKGEALDRLLGEKLFKKTQKLLFKKTGINLINLNSAKPILITNLLTESLLSADNQYSLDEDLWRYARLKGKVTLGIETYQEQLNILDNIPLKHQIKSLKETTRNFKKFRKKTLQLTKYFQAGDIQKLYKMGKKGLGELRKMMLYDRNVIMANRIADMAKEQSICCAIGAGHLAGQKGVLRLLKREGFKVSPVSA